MSDAGPLALRPIGKPNPLPGRICASQQATPITHDTSVWEPDYRDRRQIRADPLDELQFAVVVAVIAVRMVQVPLDQIVNVIAVRDGFVTAPRPVLVVLGVASAVVLRRALIGVRHRDRNGMLIVVVFMGMMEMPIVQVVGMAVMQDGGVPAVGAVDVLVIRVNVMLRHGFNPPMESCSVLRSRERAR